MNCVPKPTDAELEVLHVLWERGPSTVREIHAVVNQHKTRGYTTILKTVTTQSFMCRPLPWQRLRPCGSLESTNIDPNTSVKRRVSITCLQLDERG